MNAGGNWPDAGRIAVMNANPYDLPEHYAERREKSWIARRSFVHQRFGPVVARWYLRAVCACLFTMLLVFMTVSAFLLASGPALKNIPWIGIVLSFLGMAMLWRMYNVGVAELTSSKVPS